MTRTSKTKLWYNWTCYKRITRKYQGLQSNLLIAYINSHILRGHDKVYDMLNAASISIAGFDDGSDTPKTYNDVLKHQNQKVRWDSLKKEFHAMATKGVLEVLLMSSMPPGRKPIGNRWVYNEKDDVALRSGRVPHVFS
jgi:hypothetical protein